MGSDKKSPVATYFVIAHEINLYNFATQKNQELEQAKSLYFGSISKSEEEHGSEIEGGNSCNISLSEDKEKAAANGG